MLATKLAGRFDIPNALHIEEAPGGMVRVVVATPIADATVYLHGAHVTDWTPHGQKPVLFVSSKSLFAADKPIRGGVPVIFPWFGPRGDGQAGPMHGFARITEWELENTALREDGSVEVMLGLRPDDAARGFGFGAYSLRYQVIFGRELKMTLAVRNEGEEPLVYEEALHTYFAVADIRETSFAGLEGTAFIDKTDGFKRKESGREPLRLEGETDRVYPGTQAPCVIHDPVWKRNILVEKSGSDTTVIWNPWIAKTATLADMAAGEWEGMVCVETANAGENAVRLTPGASHQMTASIRLATPPGMTSQSD